MLNAELRCERVAASARGRWQGVTLTDEVEIKNPHSVLNNGRINTSSTTKVVPLPLAEAATLLSLRDISPIRGITSRGRQLHRGA